MLHVSKNRLQAVVGCSARLNDTLKMLRGVTTRSAKMHMRMNMYCGIDVPIMSAVGRTNCAAIYGTLDTQCLRLQPLSHANSRLMGDKGLCWRSSIAVLDSRDCGCRHANDAVSTIKLGDDIS